LFLFNITPAAFYDIHNLIRNFRLIATSFIYFIFGISFSIHVALQMSKIKHKMSQLVRFQASRLLSSSNHPFHGLRPSSPITRWNVAT